VVTPVRVGEPGDVVLATVDDGTTCKLLRGGFVGLVVLDPGNDDHSPIVVTNGREYHCKSVVTHYLTVPRRPGPWWRR